MNTQQRTSTRLAIAAICTALPGLASATPSYRITDLGALTPPWVEPGTETSWASDINNAGQVVGVSDSSSYPAARGFLWQSGNMLMLEGLPGESLAYGINNLGQVVGTVGNEETNPTQAFLWQYGSMIRLGEPHPPGEGIYSSANDIGDLGIAVGSNAGQPVAWWFGLMFGLGTLPGQPSAGAANAINGLGQVVGWSQVGGSTRAVLWEWGGSSIWANCPAGSAAAWPPTSICRGRWWATAMPRPECAPFFGSTAECRTSATSPAASITAGPTASIYSARWSAIATSRTGPAPCCGSRAWECAT